MPSTPSASCLSQMWDPKLMSQRLSRLASLYLLLAIKNALAHEGKSNTRGGRMLTKVGSSQTQKKKRALPDAIAGGFGSRPDRF